MDPGQCNSIRGNLGVLLIWLALAWSLAASGEEMAYRGYVLNRLGDLLGRNKAAWIPSLILIALLFAFGHPYHYLTGVVDNFPWGVVYRPLYLVLGGNLWLPFVAHGVENTAALVLLFFGSIF